jgi:hypothetical protein
VKAGVSCATKHRPSRTLVGIAGEDDLDPLIHRSAVAPGNPARAGPWARLPRRSTEETPAGAIPGNP